MKVIPLASLEFGDKEARARARWVVFATDFPPGTPPHQVRECGYSKARPVHFARVQHRDDTGRLTGSTLHPNLLSPVALERAEQHGLSLTRPGFVPAEIGDNT